jgi:myo-inositol catabolism protein IolC
MTPGYDKPLYLLPFDHRHSYESGMFGFKPPLTPAQHAKVADSKQVIYEGFILALEEGVDAAAAGILVDEEFGASILRAAAAAQVARRYHWVDVFEHARTAGAQAARS